MVKINNMSRHYTRISRERQESKLCVTAGFSHSSAMQRLAGSPAVSHRVKMLAPANEHMAAWRGWIWKLARTAVSR